MNFKDLQKELKSIKVVSNLSLIGQNVIKVDLEKSVSKAFFTRLKDDFYFEHCSLITAVDNQPDFELVAFDFVSNPSTHGAFLSPVNESVNNVIQKKYHKVENIISKIIREF